MMQHDTIADVLNKLTLTEFCSVELHRYCENALRVFEAQPSSRRAGRPLTEQGKGETGQGEDFSRLSRDPSLGFGLHGFLQAKA